MQVYHDQLQHWETLVTVRWLSCLWCICTWVKCVGSRTFLENAWQGWPKKGERRHIADSLHWVISSLSLVLWQSVRNCAITDIFVDWRESQRFPPIVFFISVQFTLHVSNRASMGIHSFTFRFVVQNVWFRGHLYCYFIRHAPKLWLESFRDWWSDWFIFERLNHVHIECNSVQHKTFSVLSEWLDRNEELDLIWDYWYEICVSGSWENQTRKTRHTRHISSWSYLWSMIVIW